MKVIDPRPEDVVVFTYPNSLDGWLSAWVMRGIARGHNIPVEFETFEQRYNNPASLINRNWIVVGATAGADHVRSIIEIERRPPGAERPIPFRDWERTFPYGIKRLSPGLIGHVHDDLPLSSLTWGFFRAPAVPPYLFQALQESVDHPVAVCAETYDLDFKMVDRLITAAGDPDLRATMQSAGLAVLRDRAKRK